MLDTESGDGCMPGCAFAGIGLVIAVICIAISPVLGTIVGSIYCVLVGYGVYWRNKEDKRRGLHRISKVEHLAPAQDTGQNPTRIESIRALHGSIERMVERYQDNALVREVIASIKEQSDDLLGDAERVYAYQRRVLGHIRSSRVNEEEILALEQRAAVQMDQRIAQTMHLTITSKKSELQAIKNLSSKSAYLDALLEQAEATLSELKSRIAVAVTESLDYIDPSRHEALMNSSLELSSVSESMRKTLDDLKTSG